MKLKNIISGICVVMAIASCEKSHLNDNMYDPAVYIVNHGINDDVFYVVEGRHTVDINAYCAGVGDIDPAVSVKVSENALEKWNKENGQNLKMLPEDCYVLESSVKTMSDARTTFSLDFDCDRLAELSETEDFSDLTGYAVPVVLESHTDGIGLPADKSIAVSVVVPKMNLMSFFFEQAGASEVNLSSFEDDGEYISYSYRIYTPVENHWDNEVSFEFNFDEEGLAHETLPEGSYTLTSSAEKFTEGVSEIFYTVKIDKDAVDDQFFTMTARVKSNGEYILGGESSSTVDVFNRYYVDNKKIKVLSCNSFVPGKGAELTIDGNISTMWESAYQSNHTGIMATPYEIVYELEEPLTSFRGVEIYRRNDKYVTDLKAGKWYVSTDGKIFTEVVAFDYGSSKEVGPLRHECAAPEDTRFIKFEVTECGRKTGSGVPLAHLSEVNIIYR